MTPEDASNAAAVIAQWEQWQRVGAYYRRRDMTPGMVPVDAVVDALLAEVAHWRHQATLAGVRR